MKNLIRIKTCIIANFIESDDKYYLITYDKNLYSIVYSVKSDIDNYANNNDIKNMGETKINRFNLTIFRHNWKIKYEFYYRKS